MGGWLRRDQRQDRVDVCPEGHGDAHGDRRDHDAGHEYPALMRRDGSFELFKDKHSFVIGGMDGVKFKNYELTLEPGDRLFVYTDGVAEATDTVNEQFGTERTLTALNQHKQESCRDLISGVRDAIEEFVNGAPQFDDITMLTITFRPGEDGKENV